MTSYTISSSAELLRNFLHSEVLAPDAKFQALQTQAGASLLFSIGTDDVLYLTREVPGTRTGWDRTDISSSVTSGIPGSRCVDFGAAQCVAKTSATIHLALVIRDGKEDHLFLSLNNPDADSSWAQAPQWTSYPFDNPDHKLAKVTIVNVFLSEATGKEYIVVDVLRDPASTQNLVYRYYVDPGKPGGYAWHPHDLAIDLSASGYTSCLGRKAGQALDGLYTAGQVSGHAQLIYQPLYNPYGTTPPPPSRFSLPGGAVAEAIAACRKSDNTSDLYLTSGSALYYLASKSQQDGALAVRLTASPMFAGTRALFAAPYGSGVIVWGLNGSDQVFYTTCGGNPATGPWSVPLPIVTGAEQVSPYLDRALDANTFFCHTGVNQLTKAVKSPDTGMWTFRDITLEPPATTAPARDVMSYTSTIRVTDADGQPVTGLAVDVQASNVTSVYINYLHYVAGPVTPVQVKTDSNGTLTIVEPVSSLGGSQLTVTAGDTQLTVNPMDNAVRKAASLTTPDALTSARITSPDGTTRPFIPAGTSGSDLQAVAGANQALGQAYDVHQAGAARPAAAAGPAAVARPAAVGPAAVGPAVARPAAVAADLGGLIADAGDLVRSVVNAAIDECQVLYDDARQVVTLLVSIGGQLFRAELDRLEHIAASIGEFLAKIVDDIKKVLEFLEFLFEWRDITRTKDVLKTMTKVFLSYQVSQIPALRAALDRQILDAEAQLASWAGVPDWAGLDPGTPAAKAAAAPPQSAPGSMLSYHYQNNAQDATLLGTDPVVSASPGPGQDAANVLEREGDTLYAAIQRLLDLGGRVTTTPLPDILTELAAIVGEAVLESARNVLDAMFDLVADLAQAALDLLDTPIHIPVVSDLLKFFGVPEFSFLDVICWVGAIPATLMYKVVTGTAPFPDTPHTAALIGVRDYPSLLAMFGAAPAVVAAPQAMVAAPQAMVAAPQAQAADPSPADIAIHFTGHYYSGAAAVLVTPIMATEIIEEPDSFLGSLTGPLSLFGGLAQVAAAYVANKLVPYEAIENIGVSTMNDVLMCARVAFKIVGAAVAKFDPWPDNVPVRSVGALKISDVRGLFAFLDMLLAIVGVIPILVHFVELSQPEGSTALEIATIDEVSNVTQTISRICYGAGVNLPEAAIEGKVIWAMFFVLTNLATGAMQIAEAGWVLG